MSRRDGEVTLTPAMARWLYGVLFEGREHLFTSGGQQALLQRFHKAGYGQPVRQLAGQQQLPVAPEVTEYSSLVVDAEQERVAAEQLALDNAAVAQAHPERYTSAAGGVTGGLGHQERMADPNDYQSQEQMHEVAAERAKHGHGVAAGTY